MLKLVSTLKSFRERAQELQRQGFLLSEIAKELRASRSDVVQVLYWEIVE